MGWTFPWASSHDDDFNYDFNVSVTEEEQRAGGSFTTTGAAGMRPSTRCHGRRRRAGRGQVRDRPATYLREAPGVSAFALEDSVVYHTYSAYARGVDEEVGHVPVARPRAEGSQRGGPLVPAPRRVLAHSPGSSENSVLSTRRPSGFGIDRTTPSRLNPARSRTRSEAVFPSILT